jgi:endonuclease G
MKTSRSLLFAALAFVAASLHAAPTECPQHFAGGEAPEFSNEKLAARAVPLCFAGNGSLHSGMTKTPFWSAYRLTAAKIEAGKDMSRDDSFHAEPRLPKSDRAELKDYARSGYDKGHLYPNKSTSTREEQYDSFSLANIAPQVPKHNRGIWSAIEAATRSLATRRGELYVITGVLFEGENLLTIGNDVYVPTYFYKAIYDPVKAETGTYLSPNTEDGTYEIISIAELEQRAGINLFPTMPDSVKQATMTLPKPRMHKARQRKE